VDIQSRHPIRTTLVLVFAHLDQGLLMFSEHHLCTLSLLRLIIKHYQSKTCLEPMLYMSLHGASQLMFYTYKFISGEYGSLVKAASSEVIGGGPRYCMVSKVS
jgi:hypothetical protein